jgi:hypothetical protein
MPQYRREQGVAAGQPTRDCPLDPSAQQHCRGTQIHDEKKDCAAARTVFRDVNGTAITLR